MADAPATPPEHRAEPPGYYVYAPGDIRPRQTREQELCAKASQFDWVYTGATALGFVGSVYVNVAVLKQHEDPGIRLIGPGAIGLFWGAFLTGGYLSLPKCDPTWAYGTPPEGNIRAEWPTAVAISMIATASAPAFDWIFIGPPKPDWTTREKSFRIFTGMAGGLVGSLVPYLLPPKPWAAKLEIEKLRVAATADGGFVSWGTSF